MVISEIEVVGLLQFAVRQVAEKLGIADVAWKGVTELLEENRRTRSHDLQRAQGVSQFLYRLVPFSQTHRPAR